MPASALSEVEQQPQLWKQIDEEVTEELDWQPAQFIKRLYIRPKFVAVDPKAEQARALVDQAVASIYVQRLSLN